MSNIVNDNNIPHQKYLLSVCDDIKYHLLDTMLDNNEQDLSPRDYLEEHFDTIYALAVDTSDEPEEFKSVIYDLVFLELDFDDVYDSIQEMRLYPKDPYKYNGVKRSDFL